jgi:phenylpyruvate tautomerase PptA (4-oxalocrotonate tautomerase family)
LPHITPVDGVRVSIGVILTSVLSKLAMATPPREKRSGEELLFPKSRGPTDEDRDDTRSKEMTMPLWKIYHPVGAYTREDKHALSKRITDIYSQIPLPKFYVNVVFQEIPQDSFYVGGEPVRNFVRIHMDHIARQLTSEAAKTKFFARVEGAIAPFIKDRGFEWEIHVNETPFDLWMVQGIRPPRAGTEDEKRWIFENRPSPRTHD